MPVRLKVIYFKSCYSHVMTVYLTFQKMFKLSVSFLFNFGRFYLSRNLSISYRLSNLLTFNCLLCFFMIVFVSLWHCLLFLLFLSFFLFFFLCVCMCMHMCVSVLFSYWWTIKDYQFCIFFSKKKNLLNLMIFNLYYIFAFPGRIFQFLYILISFQFREDPLTFILRQVWYCWTHLIFPCLRSSSSLFLF